MTADWYTSIKLTGTQEQILSMLHLLQTYEADTAHPESFIGICIKGEHNLDISHASDDKLANQIQEATEQNPGSELLSITVTASGPWGRYGQIDEISLFEELAKASDGGKYELDIDGGTCYTNEHLTARYSGDAAVEVRYEGVCYDEEDEAYEQYISTVLPFSEFLTLSGLTEDDVDECEYADFIACTLEDESYEECCAFAGLSEEAFTEEKFQKLLKMLKDKNITLKDAYLENADIGRKSHFLIFV